MAINDGKMPLHNGKRRDDVQYKLGLDAASECNIII